MKMTSFLVLSSLFVTSAFASKDNVNVIYGDDNRKDVYETTNSAFVELSKSTAAMMSANNLKTKNNNEVEINASNLRSRGICASERFSSQLSAANCSGFLVGEDILVTAGHCITNNSDCKSWKWVFDFKVDSADQVNITVPASSVYSCKKIISRKQDNTTKDDYAVIQLDRKTDRRPLSFRKSGKISLGDELVVIGHPTGLPTKISDGAAVRSLKTKFFMANLDTYGGNSGSAVFNVKTSEVEGILVRGENDYVYDSAQGCQVSNRCSNTGCRGEDVTYITNISAIKNIH